MALDDNLMQELEAAVEQSVEEAKAEQTVEVEVKDGDAGTKTADDVGAETVDGKAGTPGTASGDGDRATTTEKGSTPSGDGEPGTTDTDTKVADTKVPLTISDAVLTEAVRHGIPIEDARLFPNDAALGRAIQTVRKSIEQFAPKEEKKEEDDPLAALPTLDKEQYEPEVISMFDAVIGVVKKQQEQLKELRKNTEQYNANSAQAQQAATQREVTEWFDGQVAKLGDDFKDVLGVGGTDALPSGSTSRAKRDAIANQAAILFAGYNATGTQPASRDEVFIQAARTVLADEYTKISEKKLTDSLGKRSKQHIQRAGGNQKAKQSGDPAAIAAEELKKLFPGLTH